MLWIQVKYLRYIVQLCIFFFFEQKINIYLFNFFFIRAATTRVVGLQYLQY